MKLLAKIQIATPLFLAGALFCIPSLATAAGLVMSAPQKSYSVGDSFAVAVSVLTAGDPINTVSGKLNIDPAFFDIVDIRSGNSVLSLWIEKPAYNKSLGVVSFSGGVPGGFTGVSGPLFTLGLKAKKIGSTTLSFKDVSILKNDGQGTALSGLKNASLTLSVVAAKEVSPEIPVPEVVYLPPKDTTPPDPFVPLVSQHPTVADNAYFVSFSAVDKDSGIDHYEVSERLLYLPAATPEWYPSESPAVLKNQMWITEVRVRAYDREGNFQESTAVKPFSRVLVVEFFVALILMLSLALRKRSKKSRPRKKNLVQ